MNEIQALKYMRAMGKPVKDIEGDVWEFQAEVENLQCTIYGVDGRRIDKTELSIMEFLDEGCGPFTKVEKLVPHYLWVDLDGYYVINEYCKNEEEVKKSNPQITNVMRLDFSRIDLPEWSA